MSNRSAEYVSSVGEHYIDVEGPRVLPFVVVLFYPAERTCAPSLFISLLRSSSTRSAG